MSGSRRKSLTFMDLRPEHGNKVPDLRAIRALNAQYENLAARMKQMERRLPFIFEFLGSPKSGKTKVRDMVAHLASKAGLRVFSPIEGAFLPARKPLREDLVTFNVWTGTYALQNLLSACVPANQFDVVLLDRGLVDAYVWFHILRQRCFITPESAAIVQAFFGLQEWTRRINGLIAMTCEVDEALLRDKRNQLSVADSIVTSSDFLTDIVTAYRDPKLYEGLALRGTVLGHVDTTGCNSQSVALSIARAIASVIEDALDPKLVVLPASAVDFTGFLLRQDAPIDDWDTRKELSRQSQAERDPTKKQIVAYAFIEIGDRFFRVRRTGAANRPELMSKLSLGIGGHVEEIDGDGDIENYLHNCVLRELGEELVFDGTPEIEFVGFINDESIDAGRYHVAAVFRVRLAKGRVRVRTGIYDQEFGEHSWAVIPREKVFEETEQYDPWSRHIIHRLLGGPVYCPSAQSMLPFLGDMDLDRPG